MVHVDDDATTDGRTLLMHACAQCDVDRRRVADVVKYIVDELRADVAAVDHRGRTALYHAVHSGQLDAATYLLSRPASRQRLVDVDGRSLLVAAVCAGKPETVSLLLECASISRQLVALTDVLGRGPVHHWVTAYDDSTTDEKSRRLAVLLDLIKHRCDANTADSCGITALMAAATECRAGAVGALLQLRDSTTSTLEVDAVDSGGRTALHHCCAAVPPSLRCCRALIRAGADANAADISGVTPLMLTCQAYVPGANVAVIRYLVEKGAADPVIQDSEGRDSYDYCPPIDSQYVRAVLRSASGMATEEKAALKLFVDEVCSQQTSSGVLSSPLGPPFVPLHIASILRGLVRERIFTRTLSFEVTKQVPTERLPKLAELLAGRGRRAFAAFCRVLKNDADQPELAYMMMKAAYCRQPEIFC